MPPLVSVVMPVYNNAPYLHQCLDSVINQTLKDIEIVCVDDGSTDDSVSILNEYATKDSRISIYQQKNSGAGVARNLGMTKATGQYIIFLDSDDFFELNLLEDACAACEENNADFVVFRGLLYDNQTKKVAPYGFRPLRSVIKKKTFSYADINADYMSYITAEVPWNKLFRRSFVDRYKLEFSQTKHSNDSAFSMAAAYLAKRVTYINHFYVYYRKNIKSNIQSSAHKDWIHYINISEDLFKLTKDTENFTTIEQEIKNVMLRWLTMPLLRFLINNEVKNVEEMSAYLNQKGFENMGLKDLPSKYIYDGYVYNIYSAICSNVPIKYPKNRYIRMLSNVYYCLIYNPLCLFRKGWNLSGNIWHIFALLKYIQGFL